MKKVIAIFLLISLLAGMSACVNGGKDETVLQAVRELKEAWKQEYATKSANADGYFEIKNTRVIHIKDNSVPQFENVACIVEFVLYTDYYGSAPYYWNVGYMDSVTVYKDGTMEVNSMNPLKIYSGKTYSYDFSGFVAAVSDHGSEYNQTEKLK